MKRRRTFKSPVLSGRRVLCFPHPMFYWTIHHNNVVGIVQHLIVYFSLIACQTWGYEIVSRKITLDDH